MIVERFFISGPMSNIPSFNRPAFYQAENVLRKRNPHAFIYNPAKLNFDDGTYLDYMILNIPMLLSCNTLVLLEGWSNSKGAVVEKMLAEYVGITILLFDKGSENRI